ncbi:MAG: hypothetical protein ABFD89_10675 [Bryobacteraceae bacterium]
MDLLLQNLRTIGTQHCDPTVGEEAAQEIERLRAALAAESSRKCGTEQDCVWQPHCAHAGKCMRPEHPFGA